MRDTFLLSYHIGATNRPLIAWIFSARALSILLVTVPFLRTYYLRLLIKP